MNRRDWLVRASAVLAALHVVKTEPLSVPETLDIDPVPEDMDWSDEVLSKPYPPKEIYFASDRAGVLSEYPIIGSRESPAVFFGQRPRLQLSLSMEHGAHAQVLQEAYLKEQILRVEHNGVSLPMIVSACRIAMEYGRTTFDFTLVEILHPRDHWTQHPFSLDRALRSAVIKGEISSEA